MFSSASCFPLDDHEDGSSKDLRNGYLHNSLQGVTETCNNLILTCSGPPRAVSGPGWIFFRAPTPPHPPARADRLKIFIQNRKKTDSQLQSDFGLVWKGQCVQSTDKDTTGKDKNVCNTVWPPSGSLGPSNLNRLPPSNHRHWTCLVKVPSGPHTDSLFWTLVFIKLETRAKHVRCWHQFPYWNINFVSDTQQLQILYRPSK